MENEEMIKEAEKTLERILGEYSFTIIDISDEIPTLKVKFRIYSQFMDFLPKIDDYPSKINNVSIIYAFLG